MCIRDSIETLVSEGHPGSTIVNTAKERDIDLIVIGAVGHSTIDRMLLGSVSAFVATHASCSVLVVRPTGLREAAHPSLRPCIACLLYTSDAADERSSGALGGRRIIKKNNKQKKKRSDSLTTS